MRRVSLCYRPLSSTKPPLLVAKPKPPKAGGGDTASVASSLTDPDGVVGDIGTPAGGPTASSGGPVQTLQPKPKPGKGALMPPSKSAAATAPRLSLIPLSGRGRVEGNITASPRPQQLVQGGKTGKPPLGSTKKGQPKIFLTPPPGTAPAAPEDHAPAPRASLIPLSGRGRIEGNTENEGSPSMPPLLKTTLPLKGKSSKPVDGGSTIKGNKKGQPKDGVRKGKDGKPQGGSPRPDLLPDTSPRGPDLPGTSPRPASPVDPDRRSMSPEAGQTVDYLYKGTPVPSGEELQNDHTTPLPEPPPRVMTVSPIDIIFEKIGATLAAHRDAAVQKAGHAIRTIPLYDPWRTQRLAGGVYADTGGGAPPAPPQSSAAALMTPAPPPGASAGSGVNVPPGIVQNEAFWHQPYMQPGAISPWAPGLGVPPPGPPAPQQPAPPVVVHAHAPLEPRTKTKKKIVPILLELRMS